MWSQLFSGPEANGKRPIPVLLHFPCPLQQRGIQINYHNQSLGYVFSWTTPRSAWKGAGLPGPKQCWGMLCTSTVHRSELPRSELPRTFPGIGSFIKQIQPFTLTALFTTIKNQWSILIYLRKNKRKNMEEKLPQKSYGAGGALNACSFYWSHI